MKITLSTSDYLRNFERLISSLDFSEPDQLTIYSHPKWLNVHPAVLTLITALAIKVGKSHVKFADLTASSGSYLDRMGLFNYTAQQSPYKINKKEAAGRFIPIHIIKNSTEQSKFISDMIPLLHLPADKADAVKYTIGELIRNVLEHARAKEGAIVAAQYYKKSNTIRIGICDSGIGIRSSFLQFWPSHTDTDIDAIKWALTPGISGTTRKEGGTEENAGAGLFFIKSMAKVARNYFMIYSGTGIYKLLLHDKRTERPRLQVNPNDDRHSERNDAPYFQGTLVAIDLSLDNNVEFTELLASIREVYSNAIRERKKRKYKQPKFI
ncbi:MAG: ATP-binding protein [Candidatus Roizmanbacteria bacterium]